MNFRTELDPRDPADQAAVRFLSDEHRRLNGWTRMRKPEWHRIDTTKHDRRVMLKIKLASLAAEARLIRREELKRIGGALRTSLQQHRTRDVRWEARVSHLAYGVIRGVPIERMERNWDTLDDPFDSPVTRFNWRSRRRHVSQRVIALVRKYGDPKLELPAWLIAGAAPDPVAQR